MQQRLCAKNEIYCLFFNAIYLVVKVCNVFDMEHKERELFCFDTTVRIILAETQYHINVSKQIIREIEIQ